MRIGILTSVHPPMDTRIYFKQALSLARAGHTVYLVARDGGNPAQVEYVPVPASRSRWGRLRTVFQVMRHALRLRCDAYHIHDPELLPIGILVKLITRSRLVYDVHENVRGQIRNKYWIPRGLRGAISRLYGAVERVCLHWIDQVILAEDSYVGSYRKHRVTVVRNYPIIPSAVQSTRRRHYTGRPVIAYCGVVARIRGGLEMIEAVGLLRQRFPDLELRVIGPFSPQSFRGEMSALIRKHGLSDHVRLLGRLPLDQALCELEKCDIGLAVLHPDANYLESLPTKMFDYMSLRLPVVVSNFPLWKSIVEKARCGMAVDPLRPGEIAEAIGAINISDEKLRALGENGRRAVLERYTWRVEESKLLRIYAEGSRGDPESPRDRSDAFFEVVPSGEVDEPPVTVSTLASGGRSR